MCKALESTATTLKGSMLWFSNVPNQREKFCLDFMTAYLDKTSKSSSSFDWIQSLCESGVIQSIGEVLQATGLKGYMDTLPVQVTNSQSPSVVHFFEWIVEVHDIMYTLHKKILAHDVNYDVIFLYMNCIRSVKRFCSSLMITELAVQEKKLTDMMKMYEDKYQELNSLLLKQVHGEKHDK